MALKPFVDSVDQLPEGLQSHYVEDVDSGKYVLSVETDGGYALENVSGLKSTLGKLKERVQQAETALKSYAELDMNAEEISNNLSELQSLRESRGDESAEITALKQQLEGMRQQSKAEVEKAIAPIAGKLDARTNQLKEVTIINELRKAIVEGGGNPTLLVPALLSSVKAEESEDGRISPVVIDAEGTPRVQGASLEPMSFTALVDEIKSNPDFAMAFQANGASGGGTAARVNNNSSSVTADQISNMSMAEYKKARADGVI